MRIFLFLYILIIIGCVQQYPTTPNIILPGDINCDGKADHIDLELLSDAFGAVLGASNWNPNADLDNNGRIDGIDLIILSRNFGKTI